MNGIGIKNFKAELLIYLPVLLLTLLWFWVTDSYVNEEALHTFYQPLLRSLQILDELGFKGVANIIATHHGPYPYGIYLFPFFFHYSGLNHLVSSYPEMVVGLLVLFWCLICSLLFSDSRKSIAFFLLCFSFPLFSVSLKSFSPHAWNVLSCFFFVMFFERYKKSGRLSDLLPCLLSGVLCVSIKHFGLMLVLLFFFCELWDGFCFRRDISKIPLFMFFVFLGGLAFYPQEQLWNYVSIMFYHHYHFRLIHGLLLVLLFIILVLISVFPLRYAKENYVERNLAGNEFFILFHILLVLFYFFYLLPLCLESAIFFYPFLFLLAVFGFLSLLFCHKESFSLYAFFYTSLGLAYFLYLFAHHVDFFVFPFVLLFFLAVKEGLNRRFNGFLIVSGLLIGNFFPSLHQIEVAWGWQTRDAFIRLFSSTSWYPWSWRYNPMKKLTEEMRTILRPYFGDRELVALCYRMSFKTQQELNWPPYFLIDQLPGGVEEAFLEISDYGVETTFTRWLADGKVPVIVELLPEWIGQYVFEPDMGLERLSKGFELNEHPESRALFAQMVGEAWMEFLHKKALFGEFYNSFTLLPGKPLIKLHILRSLKPDFRFKHKERAIIIDE